MSFKAHQPAYKPQDDHIFFQGKPLYHAILREKLDFFMREGIHAKLRDNNPVWGQFRMTECTVLYADKNDAIMGALHVSARMGMNRSDIVLLEIDTTDMSPIGVVAGSLLEENFEYDYVFSKHNHRCPHFGMDYFNKTGRIARFDIIPAQRLSIVSSGCYHVPKIERIKAYWKTKKPVAMIRHGKINELIYDGKNHLEEMTFWHCTPKSKIDSILEKGLLPQPVLCMASTIHLASFFGHLHSNMGDDMGSHQDELAMIKIEGKSLDPQFIVADINMIDSHHNPKVARLKAAYHSHPTFHALDKSKSIAYAQSLIIQPSQVYDYGAMNFSLEDAMKEYKYISGKRFKSVSVRPKNPQRLSILNDFTRRIKAETVMS